MTASPLCSRTCSSSRARASACQVPAPWKQRGLESGAHGRGNAISVPIDRPARPARLAGGPVARQRGGCRCAVTATSVAVELDLVARRRGSLRRSGARRARSPSRSRGRACGCSRRWSARRRRAPSIRIGSPPHGNAAGSSNVNSTSRLRRPLAACARSASRPAKSVALSTFTAKPSRPRTASRRATARRPRRGARPRCAARRSCSSRRRAGRTPGRRRAGRRRASAHCSTGT